MIAAAVIAAAAIAARAPILSVGPRVRPPQPTPAASPPAIPVAPAVLREPAE